MSRFLILVAFIAQMSFAAHAATEPVKTESVIEGNAAYGAKATAELQTGLDAYKNGDYSVAINKLVPLANNGDATAQFQLGLMNENGQGVPQNYKRAVMRYSQAARQNNAEAQFRLGKMYELGQGVPKDKMIADEWFAKSSAQKGKEHAAKQTAIPGTNGGLPGAQDKNAFPALSPAPIQQVTAISHISSAVLNGNAAMQPVSQSPSWTFEKIARSALATHPSIQSKRSSSAAAQADLDAANWQKYPSPSIQSGDVGSGYDGMARIDQPIWTGGRITAGIDSARAHFVASQATINETKQDVLLKVINAYIEAMRQQERQAITKKDIAQYEDLLSMISRRVVAEVSPPADKELARSRLYQAANDLSDVTQALENSFSQLSQLSGQSVRNVSVSLDSKLLTIPQTREKVFELTVGASPTLKRFTLDEDAASADISSKKSAYMPQLSVRMEKTFGLLSEQRTFLAFESQPGAGLSASAGVDGAIAKREAVRQDRDSALRDLLDQTTQDWNAWVASRNRLENAKLASISSKDVYESYTRQFTAGRKSWLDVMNAVREAAQSELTVADMNAQVVGSALRLKLRMGLLNPEGTN